MSYEKIVHNFYDDVEFETEFVYINHHSSRFTPGNVYKAIVVQFPSFTTGPDSIIRVIDKDGVPMDISRDMFDLTFVTKRKWREMKLDQLGI